MDRDISLSQTLGGLRIANPDDAESSPPSSDQPRESLQAGNALTQVPTVQSAHSHDSTLQLSSGEDGGSLGFDPASYSTESFMTEELSRMPSQVISTTTSNTSQPAYSPVAPSPAPIPAPQPSAAAVARQPSRTASQRRSNRTSAVPAAYPSHPQAAAAAYAAMNQRTYPPNGRPSSAYLGGPGGQLSSQKDPYRLHKEPSQASLNAPRRVKSTTRKAVAEAQAGVPNLEASHTERSYGSRPPVYTGASVPRRKSSRGLQNVQSGQYLNPYGASNGSSSEAQGHGAEGQLHSSEEWKDKGASIVGKHTEMVDGRPVTKFTRRGVKDFSFGQLLGEGSYSQVMLARDRNDGTEYAVKILDKRHIIKEKKVKYVNIEKDTLNRLANHPGVVRLHYTFQDERSLYFVLDFASNGELLGVLKKMGTFDEDCTRFYSAQLLETIEYMHSRGVIHRDLKPENILLDRQMHTKITDFGTAKMLTDPKRSRTNSATNPQGPPGGNVAPDDPGEQSDRANSFVGTAEYVSPELLTDKSACKASDLWAFGCIVYQLLAGRPPFKAGSEYLTFQKIIKLDYKFPPGFPPAARDLIERCLVLDPRQRVTIEHIKSHDFFRGIAWGRSLWQQSAPKLRSYQPPAAAPIRLGDDQKLVGADSRAGNVLDSYPPDIQPSHSTRPVHISSNSPNSAKPSTRPSPRVITELPPPSQLDIEWSPVLSKDNERIVKLSNLAFLAGASKDAPAGHKHGDSGGADPAVKETGGGGGAFKRLFGGGGNNKKKTRMVMVTSNGRLLIANDTNDKKLKFEINLLADGTSWQQATDAKGIAYWCLETKEKHFTFEDPKGSSSDLTRSTQMTQEWLEALDRARDMALSQNMGNSSYSSMMATPSTSKSPTLNMNFGESSNTSANDLSGSRWAPGANQAGLIDQVTNNASTRNHLQKSRDGKDGDGEDEGRGGMSRGFKRFSKRQSKSGLAAVF